MSEKTRQKITTKATEVSGSPQTDGVIGQRKFAMTPNAWVFVAVLVVVVIALAVVLKTVPIPGVIFVVIFMQMTKPRRVLTVGPAGYSNFTGSVWSTAPKKLIGSSPAVQFVGGNEVVVDGESITLPKKEMNYFKEKMQAPMMSTPAAIPGQAAPPFQASAFGGQDQGSFPNPPQPIPPSSYPQQPPPGGPNPYQQ